MFSHRIDSINYLKAEAKISVETQDGSIFLNMYKQRHISDKIQATSLLWRLNSNTCAEKIRNHGRTLIENLLWHVIGCNIWHISGRFQAID